MKKQLHILQGLIILIVIFISILLSIKFLYHINNEEMDTSYMWNINFENLKIKDGSKEGNITLKDNNLNLNITLKNETEFYEFTLDIKNSGTLDAELEKLVLNVDNPKNILTYKITYLDGTEVKEGDILNSNSISTIIVRIDYPKQKDKIYDELKLSLTLNMKYRAIH